MVSPCCHRVGDLADDIRAASSRARKNVKRMVGAVDHRQPRAFPQALDRLPDQGAIRQRVSGALQEQHRDADRRQMIRSGQGWLVRGVERKSEKRQSANAGKRGERLRLRCHTAAERLAARNQRNVYSCSRAQSTAARTAAWHAAGGSGRRAPRSMYGN